MTTSLTGSHCRRSPSFPVSTVSPRARDRVQSRLLALAHLRDTLIKFFRSQIEQGMIDPKVTSAAAPPVASSRRPRTQSSTPPSPFSLPCRAAPRPPLAGPTRSIPTAADRTLLLVVDEHVHKLYVTCTHGCSTSSPPS